MQPYPWGSLTAIPDLLGEAQTGAPQAELWIGAHSKAPSRIRQGGDEGPTLDAWIRRDPEGVLGADVAERFGGELPFLLKVLAAAAPLSIQAHPNQAQAEAGFSRENAAGVPLDACDRSYRDPNHKPELICALTPFRALNRFREPAEIDARISALGVEGLEPIVAPLREMPDRAGLSAFFEAWLTLEPAARLRLLGEVVEAAQVASGDPAMAELCRLSRAYPGDAGVLAPLFLNWIELAPGQAMYLPAGELHSYLEGTGVELMANSDNVLRGGLTSKHVDVPELLATLTFESGPMDLLEPRSVGPAEWRYASPAVEFALSVLRIGSGVRWESPAKRGVELLLCTEGDVVLSDARGRTLSLPRGASAIAPSAAGSYRASGAGVVHRAAVGLDFS